MRGSSRRTVLLGGLALAAWAGWSPNARAATYYVSPDGLDTNDGDTELAPWQTLTNVNATSFAPGDTILFKRGEVWRERLVASSSGDAGNPITYNAYGTGAKPVFMGSDVLDNASFGGSGPYTYTLPDPKPDDSYVFVLEDRLFLPKADVTYDSGTGVLTVSNITDPTTNGKAYSACIRGNVIHSNAQDHLVFRNLVADESAGEVDDGAVQGYGIRIEGSTDVLVEDCEAHRAGRHNVGVINSTEFVGRRINCEYAVTKYAGEDPFDNTFYVSYADINAPVAACTSLYEECTADRFENGDGNWIFFTTHGENQGDVIFDNCTVRSKLNFMGIQGEAKVLGGTLSGDASIETFHNGTIVDGVTLLDSSAVDIWADNCVVQNCLAVMTPSGGGPTGYSTAVLVRDGGLGNILRFNTLVTAGFSGLVIVPDASQSQVYGNIFQSTTNVIEIWNGTTADASDLTYCDYNFYDPAATFQVNWVNESLASWKGFTFDEHALSGDPGFAGAGDYSLDAGSTAIDAALVAPALVPATDITGAVRPAGSQADMGAYEYGGLPPVPSITSPATASGTTGQAFYYQITATGSPTSYSATGLPGGLSVDAGTGLISGTPDAAGVSVVMLSATNAAGTGELELTLSVADPGAQFALTVTSGTGSGSYEQGTVVEIAADPPPGGQVFDQWTGDVAYVASATSASTTVTMPAQDVSVTATYKDYAGPGPVDGLVGWWKLDEPSGKIAEDSSGLGNDGDLVNCEPELWAPAGGQLDGALGFDGFDDHVNCGTDASLTPASFTISFWMKPTGMFYQSPVDKFPMDTTCGWTVKMRDDGIICFFLGAESGVYGYTSAPGAYEADKWYHIAGSYDGSEIAFYIDGGKVHSENQTLTMNATSTPLLFGVTNKTPTEPFHGYVDDVRLYDRALSLAEVEALASGLPVAPLLSTATAADPSADDDYLDSGDTLTLVFDKATNEDFSNATGTQDVTGMEALFSLATGDWGTSDGYTLTWLDPATLEIEITTHGTASIPIGDTIIVLDGANVMNAAETSAACTDSATLVGDWGTYVPPPAPVITSTAAASGTVGAAFSYQIVATNSPTSYDATGLPAGLSVDTATGLVSGTPAAAGVSTVALSATNAGGTGTLDFELTVVAPQAPRRSSGCSPGGGAGAGAGGMGFIVLMAALCVSRGRLRHAGISAGGPGRGPVHARGERPAPTRRCPGGRG